MSAIFEMIRTLSPATWIGPALLATLKVTALMAAATLLVTTLTRASAATRHLVWSLALLGALVVPLASSVVPAWPVRWIPRLEHRAAPALEHRATTAIVPLLPTGPAPLEIRSDAPTLEPEPAPSQISSLVIARVADPAPAPSRPRFTAQAVMAFLPTSPLTVLPMIWVAGMLLLFARRLAASRRLARLERRAVRVTDLSWRAMLDQCARQLGVRRAVTLCMSDEVAVPMTWGTLRPVVLLPATAVSWSADRLRIVLLHELAHVRRFDTLTLSIARVATAVHWFHPLVWMAVRRMRHEAECACDDRVLDAGTRASAYAGDLLEIARSARDSDRMASAAVAMARHSRLEGRLLAILDPRRTRGDAGRIAFVSAWLVMLAGVGLLAAVRPAQSLSTGDEPRVMRSERATTRTVTTTSPAVAVKSATATSTTGHSVEDCPETVAGRTQVVATPAIEPAVMTETVAPEASMFGDAGLVAETEAPVVEVSAAEQAIAAKGGLIDLVGTKRATGTSSSIHSHTDESTHSRWSIEDDGHHKRWNGYWISGGRKVTVKAEGEIRFGREFTNIESISDGGFFTLEDEQNGHKRRVEFRPRNGRMERTFYLDNAERPWDDDSRAWVGNAFIDLDRHTGVLIDRRFPDLMAHGGPNAVLRDISQMPTDYVKGLYFAKLLASNLDRATLGRAVTQAGHEIESDYELAQMLMRAADKKALDDEGTRDAYIDAANTLESDYEHARVLMLPAQRGDLTAASVAALIKSATHIHSDYERGRVLVATTKSSGLDAATQRDYIAAASAMSSDYEKGGALRALLENGRFNAENVEPLLEASTRIESDYEAANLLVAVAKRVRLDERGRAAYRRVARTLDSDYEQNRALAALGDRDSQ